MKECSGITEQELDTIGQCVIFKDISRKDASALLNCLAAEKRTYGKNEEILTAGEPVDSIGLVLEGNVTIEKDDYWGNRNIVTVIGPGETFAESYACVPDAMLGVTVRTVGQTSVLEMKVAKVLTTCTNACVFHSMMIRNLLSLVASRNLFMSSKITFLSQRTTREKLMSYLSAESQRVKSGTFDIPFNRQQLADFLSVDRSAMSNELCRLRDEHVLKFDKNHFTLLS